MKWYLETGPEGDVVVSTRIRLARNIAEFPFISRMTEEQSQNVIKNVKDALFSANGATVDNFEFYEMEKLTPARAMSLAERHLISPQFAQNKKGCALLLSKDNSVSIMLNEEDHIRIQAMLPGMQLKQALKTANLFDDLLDEKLSYAFDENLGYLTCCPTNLGTGLRASLMLHLPATVQAGALPNLGNAMSKLGLTIRGTFGEGSEAKGAFYQVSNQITLGITETEAVDNLNTIAQQIISQERAIRESLKKQSLQLEDKIYRSHGLLKSARLISNDEFMSLISDLRLGVTMGIVNNVNLETINSLINEMQPATLVAGAGRKLDALGRDELRASKIREKLV
jgi:protein arginine kinase